MSTAAPTTSSTTSNNHGADIFQKCSQSFNDAVKLYNQRKYDDATTTLFASSSTLGMQYMQVLSKTKVTEKNKEALLKNMERVKSIVVKTYEMRGKCLFMTQKYREATQAIVQGIVFSDFHLWDQNKSDLHKLIELYVKCKYYTKKDNAMKLTTFTLHHFLSSQQDSYKKQLQQQQQQQKDGQASGCESSKQKFLSDKHWLKLLETELYCYECYNDNVFLLERNLAIDQILTHYDRETQFELYIPFLFKKTYIYYEQGLLKLAIDQTKDAMALMKTHGASNEMKVRVMVRLFLLTIEYYLERQEKIESFIKINRGTVKSPIEIEIHKPAISSLTSYYGQLMKLFEQIDRLVPHIKEDLQADDDLLDDFETCLFLMEYYGHPSVTKFASVIASINTIQPHRTVVWYVHTARLFIDLGDVQRANKYLQMSSEILCGDLRFNIEEITYASYYKQIVHAYYLSQTGQLSNALSQLESAISMLPEQKKYSNLHALCKYYFSFFLQQGTSTSFDIHSILDHCMNSLGSRMGLHAAQSVDKKEYSEYIDLCDSLLQAGQLYEYRGYIREALHYFNQGLIVATGNYCVPYIIQFVTSIGNIERKRKGRSSVDLLSEAVTLWNSLDDNSYHQIQCLLGLVELSDSYRDLHAYQDALNCLSKAQSHLDILVLSYSKATKISTPVKRRRSTTGSCVQESYTIQSLRVVIECHHALLLYAIGQCSEATSKLQICLDTMVQQKFDGQEKALVQYYMGKHFLKQYLMMDTDDNQMATELLSDASSQISFDIPTLSKQVLSSMALCAAPHDPYYSAYLSTLSMGITLKHMTHDISKHNRSNSPALEQYGKNVCKEDSHGLMKQITNILPDAIPVVNICLSHDNSHLLITRLERNYEPVVIHLPIMDVNKTSGTESKSPYTYLPDASLLRLILQEYDNIIAEDEQLGKEAPSIKTQIETRNYWHKRAVLDDRMKLLLSNAERLFGHWKILLVGPIQDAQIRKAVNSAAEQLSAKLSQFCDTINSSLVRLVLSCTGILEEKDMQLCISHLMRGALIKSEEKVRNWTELFYEAYLSVHEEEKSNEEEPNVPIISRANRVRRTRRGRSSNSDSSSPDSVSSPPQKKRKIIDNGIKVRSQLKIHPRSHTILILDKLLQRLPLESMPILRSNSLTRMPSMFQLYQLLARYQMTTNDEYLSVGSKCFYVLNPSGDLKRTEEQFSQQFEEEGWSGITNQAPTHEQIVHALESHDVFVYLGHGSGAYQYYNPEKMPKEVKRCAVALLMGCSSGALNEQGDYEPTGNVQSFILANSPCVVANLYDVTSRELDKMTQRLIDTCLKSKTDTVSHSLVRAREECRLPYLMGSATICYGLPVKLHTL